MPSVALKEASLRKLHQDYPRLALKHQSLTERLLYKLRVKNVKEMAVKFGLKTLLRWEMYVLGD